MKAFKNPIYLVNIVHLADATGLMAGVVIYYVCAYLWVLAFIHFAHVMVTQY